MDIYEIFEVKLSLIADFLLLQSSLVVSTVF